MKLVKHIGNIIFRTDTEYTEFLLGMVSIITGIWLFIPFAETYFQRGLGSAAKPELWGTLLLFSGLTKFIGVLRGRLSFRQTSCLIATFVWVFISVVFLTEDPSVCTVGQPLAPIMIVLGFFNALIYIKLRLVPRP
jgi:hypothetical protein